MNKTRHQKSVSSISYTHDPAAFELWVEAYVDLVKQAVLKQMSNPGCTSHTLNTGGDSIENGRILSEFNKSSGAFRGNAEDDGVQESPARILGH